MTTFSKKLALGISGLALAAFVGATITPATAEAGFGIKVPKIGNMVKGGSGNSGTTKNTNGNKAYRKSIQITVMEAKFYKPIVGAEVYEVHTNTNPSINDRQPVCTFDADYKLLGRTDAQGKFFVPPTVVPFGIVVSVPGNGVSYQAYGSIIEQEEWTIRCNMSNKQYQRVQFTGRQL